MKLTLLVVAICVGLLSGCASAPEYRRTSSASAQEFSDVASAVKAVVPIAKVTTEAGANIKIDDEKSPIIVFEDIKDNFEIVSLEGKRGQKYRIEVRSLCSCLGFKKRVMSPIVLLLDKNGAIVSGTPEVAGPGYLDPNMPVFLRLVFTGEFASDGTHSLFIAADNAKRDQSVGTTTLAFTARGIPFLFFPISFTSTSDGVIVVLMQSPQ